MPSPSEINWKEKLEQNPYGFLGSVWVHASSLKQQMQTALITKEDATMIDKRDLNYLGMITR